MSLLGVQRDGSGPLLVWLHGFTQTKVTGHQFRSILAGAYEVWTIDLPGHGENAGIPASLDETADLLADALPLEPFVLAGYSLGGRVALHVALRHPERLARLVLLSATAGIADEEERRQRRLRDEALATRIETVGTDLFLDEWLAQPMFAALPADPHERAARSTDARGLALSLRRAGTGTQEWLGSRLGELRMPTTIVAGANDTKFVTEAERLGQYVPHASVRFVADAGHAAHLERPEACAMALFGTQPQ
ncbi:MAG TPA: alpha/beta fold hydrolase [Acidimicrobiales bacterium]|jgi:2-succinyl-6-hydroxy-2,4-cyclohexadiene-1-carboxylate synthase|nr:alpha/beta fold hydrolase [Acidimicrobiales bacterium]